MLNSKHFIGIHGYMLVYSVASQQSFDMINVIHDKILNHLVRPCNRTDRHIPANSMQGADSVPIMIVGNKCDIQGAQRRISEEKGKKLASDLKGGFVETSARENKNVAKAFEMMIAEIERTSEPEKPAGGGKCSVM